MLQLHFEKRPSEWVVDLERIHYARGDEELFVGLTILSLGPLLIAWHHTPPE